MNTKLIAAAIVAAGGAALIGVGTAAPPINQASLECALGLFETGAADNYSCWRRFRRTCKQGLVASPPILIHLGGQD
jgi:hypothetical protein